MYQAYLNHPNNQDAEMLLPEVYESIYQIFRHICSFWRNLDDPEQYKTRLFVFMDNRMRLRPEYRQHYTLAMKTMNSLVELMGEEEAYKTLFTDKEANQVHVNTPLAVTRQKVSNELITFQISQGGFKVWGAVNTLGYIAGAYIPDEPVPYRT